MSLNIIQIMEGSIIEIFGGVIGGCFAYFIAKYQMKKEKQDSISIEAKFLIGNMKLDFFESSLNWLSKHEQALSAILTSYQELNRHSDILLAMPKDYAKKILFEYDQAETNFSQLLSSYQAKHYIIEDEMRLSIMEENMTVLGHQYQLLLTKVGISRLFMEKNTKGYGTDLDSCEEGTRYLKNSSLAFEKTLKEYVDVVRSVIIIFQNLSKVEIDELHKL